MSNELATITDSRTGEIIPLGAAKEIVAPAYAVDYSKFGTLKMEPEQSAILTEPVSNEIKIRPDGNLYVSWSFYANRLNKAFGVLQWGLIPNGQPLSKPAAYDDILVVWGHWLVVKGVPIGYAIGETTYKSNNNMMSYADACEGAKSSSLARNCKIFGASFDLWDAEFCSEWREAHAEKYKNPKNSKEEWRKKTVVSNSVITTPPSQEPETVTPETPAQSLQGVNVSKPVTQQAKPAPSPVSDDANARFAAAWNACIKAKLHNADNKQVWSRGPKDAPDVVMAKAALMESALLESATPAHAADTNFPENNFAIGGMSDPRTGDGENK